MKKVFLLLIFLLPFYFFTDKPVLAQCSADYCYRFEMPDKCYAPGCEGCSGCESVPQPVEPTGGATTGIKNPVLPSNLSNLSGLLNRFLKSAIAFIFVIGSIIFFFVFVTGGVKWITSSGDKAKLESAQKQISSGLLGLIILLSTFAIIKLIETLFGINLLNITLPTL